MLEPESNVPPQLFDDVLMPLNSGMVTVEAAARLPRQNVMQTRMDMLEGGVRLTNAYIMGGPEALGMNDPVDPFDLMPAVKVDEVVVQATEIARQKQVKTEGMLPHERVAPLTTGAFYKAFEKDYDVRSGPRKRAIGRFKRLVAERLIDAFKPGDLFAGSIEALEQGNDLTTSFRLGFEAECERRLHNPSYIFLGAAASLEGRNPILQPPLQAAYARDLAASAASLPQVLAMSGRSLRPGLSLEDLSSVFVDSIRGTVRRVRLVTAGESAGGSSERWRPASLGALAVFDSFTAKLKELPV